MESVNDLLTRDSQLGADSDSTGESDIESDVDSEEDEIGDPDEIEVESMLDMEFEDENITYQEDDEDLFEDALLGDHLVTSPTLDVSMEGIGEGASDQLPADELNKPGSRLRTCVNRLQQLHEEKVRTGRLPSWPFADYLEFEFVKWMVDHDISQGARDKLIKLPIVS